MYRNVVVAYDGTEGARAALGLRHRGPRRGGADGGRGGPGEAAAHRAGRPHSTDPRRAAETRRELREAIDSLDPELEASLWAVGGPPAKAILVVAEDIGADLIVTGSRQRGRVTSAVLGSVSAEIVHGAPCDVLIAHPAEA